MQEKQRIARVFYWIAVALQLGGLYSSVTRGATVGIAAGLLAGLVIYVFLSENRKLKKIWDCANWTFSGADYRDIFN